MGEPSSELFAMIGLRAVLYQEASLLDEDRKKEKGELGGWFRLSKAINTSKDVSVGVDEHGRSDFAIEGAVDVEYEAAEV